MSFDDTNRGASPRWIRISRRDGDSICASTRQLPSTPSRCDLNDLYGPPDPGCADAVNRLLNY